MKHLLPSWLLERLRPVVNRYRFWSAQMEPYKPWMRGQVQRAIAAARAASGRERQPRHVVFVADTARAREAKLAAGLKAAGWKVTLVTRNPPSASFAGFFESVALCASTWEMLERASALSPAVYHVFANWLYQSASLFVKYRPGKIVLDPCDVLAGMARPHLLNNRYPGQAALERFALEGADAICCRSLETQFLKRRLGYRFRGKRLFLPDYTVPDDRPVEHRPPDDEIHVAHIGSMVFEWFEPHFTTGHYLKIVERMAADRVHFHLYEGNKVEGTTFERSYVDYLALEKRSPYVHVHRAVPPDQLVHELARFDFGMHFAGVELHWGDKNSDATPERFLRYLPSRVFEYIRAGIPSILSDARFLSWYVDRVSRAHIVDPGFVESPRAWLLKRMPTPRDRERLARGAAAVDVSRHIPRLTRFYESVAAVPA